MGSERVKDTKPQTNTDASVQRRHDDRRICIGLKWQVMRKGYMYLHHKTTVQHFDNDIKLDKICNCSKFNFLLHMNK